MATILAFESTAQHMFTTQWWIQWSKLVSRWQVELFGTCYGRVPLVLKQSGMLVSTRRLITFLDLNILEGRISCGGTFLKW